MDINSFHRYSHLGEKFLWVTYNPLVFNITGTIQFCDECARSKTKACTVRNKIYTRVSNLGESIFVDMTGPFPDSLIGNWY